MTDPLRWLGALAVVGAVALLLFGERAGAPEDLDRLLVYDLDEPLRFALEPEEREIRLISWVSSVTPEPLDVRVLELYALDLKVTDDLGETKLERRVWLPTHTNRISADELRSPQQRVGSDRTLWDDRRTLVDVTGLVPRGGLLEVSLGHASADVELLITGFRHSEVDRVAVLRTVRRKVLDREEPVAPWPFSTLPESWQVNAARFEWDRLGALPPEEGGLLETHRVEVAHRRLLAPDAPAVGLPTHPGQAGAWLVNAPTTLEVQALDARTLTPVDAPLEARLTDLGGASAELLAVGGRVGPLRIETTSELRVALAPTATRPIVLRATTASDLEDRAFGDAPRLRRPDGSEWVSPDLRQIDAWRVRPGEPLVFPVLGGEELRLSLRVRLPAGPLPGLAAAVEEPGSSRLVTLEARDAAGGTLGSWSLPVLAVPSAFERYVRADVLPTRVSEPTRRFLHPPDGATSLVVTADGEVDLTLDASPDPEGPWRVVRGYELPDGAGVDTVYTPFLERPWQLRNPEGVEALTLAGRSVAFDAQVRWELADGGGAGGAVDGAPDRYPLALRGPWELLAEPQRGDPAPRVRLSTRPTIVGLPVDGRLSVDYRVDRSEVGGVVVFTIGGRQVERTLAAAAGTLRVDGVGAGGVAVAVDRPGLFLATGTGADGWWEHRVWALDDGRERVVDLPAGAGSLLLEVYRPDGSAAALAWTLEGGARVGPTEQLHRGEGVTGTPARDRAPALPLSFAGEPLTALVPVVVDRDPGDPASRLVIRTNGEGRVWVRARATWGGPGSPAARHAWQEAAP